MAIKLAIMTCVHGRREITKAFFLQRQYISEKLGIVIPIAFAYSDVEDFNSLQEADVLIKEDIAVEAFNDPLSDKHNAMLQAALTIGAKNYLHLGSNDLVSVRYVDFILKNDIEYGGIRDMYVYNHNRQKSLLLQYRNGERMLGSGRVFNVKALRSVCMGFEYKFRRPYHKIAKGEVKHVPDASADLLLERSLIERTSKKDRKVCLWFGGINRGLDNASDAVFSLAGYKQENIGKAFDFPQLFGIHTGEDLTPFDVMRGQEVSHDYMQDIAPEIIIE